MRALLGSSCADRLGMLLGWVEACVEEADAMDAPNGAVLSCAPSRPLLACQSERLYRAHCREIIARLRAPLNAEGEAVFVTLFRRVFGDDAVPGDLDGVREQWPGQVDDAIAQSRHRLRVPWRVPK